MDNICEPKIPLSVRQGKTFYLPVTYTDDQGNPINLTGYSAQMQIRDTPYAMGNPLVDLSTANGSIVISGTAGLIEVTISASTTTLFPAPYSGVYELQISSGGVIEDLIVGQFNVLPTIIK